MALGEVVLNKLYPLNAVLNNAECGAGHTVWRSTQTYANPNNGGTLEYLYAHSKRYEGGETAWIVDDFRDNLEKFACKRFNQSSECIELFYLDAECPNIVTVGSCTNSAKIISRGIQIWQTELLEWPTTTGIWDADNNSTTYGLVLVLGGPKDGDTGVEYSSSGVPFGEFGGALGLNGLTCQFSIFSRGGQFQNCGGSVTDWIGTNSYTCNAPPAGNITATLGASIIKHAGPRFLDTATNEFQGQITSFTASISGMTRCSILDPIIFNAINGQTKTLTWNPNLPGFLYHDSSLGIIWWLSHNSSKGVPGAIQIHVTQVPQGLQDTDIIICNYLSSIPSSDFIFSSAGLDVYNGGGVANNNYVFCNTTNGNGAFGGTVTVSGF